MPPLDVASRAVSKTGLGSVIAALDAEFWAKLYDLVGHYSAASAGDCRQATLRTIDVSKLSCSLAGFHNQK